MENDPKMDFLAIEMLFPGAVMPTLERKSFDDPAYESMRVALVETQHDRGLGGRGANAVMQWLDERGELRPAHGMINLRMAEISREMPEGRWRDLYRSSHLEGVRVADQTVGEGDHD